MIRAALRRAIDETRIALSLKSNAFSVAEGLMQAV
jgi:hypothetical protein